MPAIFKRNKSRSKTAPGGANRKLNPSIRAAGSRFVLSGFPVERPFQTLEEVNDYLNGDPDYLTCLRCGKQYQVLSMHLKVHAWTDESYRKFYCLPLMKGLASKRLRESRSVISLRKWDSLSDEEKKTFSDRGTMNLVRAREVRVTMETSGYERLIDKADKPRLQKWHEGRVADHKRAMDFVSMIWVRLPENVLRRVLSILRIQLQAEHEAMTEGREFSSWPREPIPEMAYRFRHTWKKK